MDKIKDDFEEELDLYMYRETDDSVKGNPREMQKKKNNNPIKKIEEKEEKNEEMKRDKEGIEEEKIEEDVNEIINDARKKTKKNINISTKIKGRGKKNWIYTIVLVLILAGLVYWNWGNLFSQPITGKVVAIVNGEELTNEEFDNIYSGIIQQYPAVDKNEVLDQTIDRMLLLQEAKKENINVNDEEVNDFINSWLEQIKSTFTEDELKQQLDAQGTTLEKITEENKKNYRESLMINRLLNETVLNKKEATLPERIKASHILVDNESEAEEILNDLKKVDFNELANEKSKDPSAKTNNGSLGWFERGAMVKEFEDAAFALKIGEISKPVKTDYGYHIIKLEDRKLEEKKIMSELSYEERSMVLPELQNVVSEYIKELRSKADIKTYIEAETSQAVVSQEEAPVINIPTTLAENEEIKTFEETGDEICEEDNKPVIRLFSTTWCPHCQWIKDAFDKVAKEYSDKGEIIAYHWELDIGDNILTAEQEKEVPETENAIYQKYNPSGSIPTFVFGCKYSRIGNGYERENDLSKEEAEFRAVIEELLK